MAVRTTSEKLKLGYIINPIAATLFPSIAFKNSLWKWTYLKWLLTSLHFDAVISKPNISTETTMQHLPILVVAKRLL
jgi:hypothetical protein